LQGNEFSTGAACIAADGEMIFGGVAGVSAFYPLQIADKRNDIKLFMTGLYVFDKKVVKGMKSGWYQIIDRFISDADEIHLSYKDNMFTLEFSTFDFGSPESVHYQYMMEGLNDQWVNTEKGANRISFTNLSYGNYKLHIKARINNQESNEKIIEIVIYPPWYLSWLAKLLYLALLGFIGWVVYRVVLERLNHKQEMMKREHQEQVNEGKLQFFINISHEIRTPMILIISPLEKLLTENPDPAKLQVYQLMYRNAQRILRLINQMLDIYLRSLSSIFFQNNLIAGALVALALLFSSRIMFSLSIIGFLSAYFFAQFTGSEAASINYYNIGANYMMVGFALGGFFLIPSKKSYLWTILLIPLTSLVLLFFYKLLGYIQLPVFSLPFAFVTITFLYFLQLRTKATSLIVTPVLGYQYRLAQALK
jgi:hypothetical protein